MDMISSPHAAGELRDLVMRTLWTLFAAFCLALVGYLALYFFSGSHGGMMTPESLASWEQWRLLFGIGGLTALYVSLRIRGVRLAPKRFAQAARKALARAAGQPQNPAATNQAYERLIGRITMDHVLLWSIVEIPAILGIVDWMVSGSSRQLFALIGMSALGLFAHRPRANQVETLLNAMRTRPEGLSHD